MPLTPLNNPFESFTWLNEFNEVIVRIINDNNRHKGFNCKPHLTKPFTINGCSMKKGKLDAAGNYDIGFYWLGFYYRLRQGQAPNRMALPWFGCQFFNEFTIDIVVHSNRKYEGGEPNHILHAYLFNNGTLRAPFSGQPYSEPQFLLRCRFDDYMKYIKGHSNFDFGNWICSSKTQEADLTDFFEVINANYLAPHI